MKLSLNVPSLGSAAQPLPSYALAEVSKALIEHTTSS